MTFKFFEIQLIRLMTSEHHGTTV